jgi:hypothetical protein
MSEQAWENMTMIRQSQSLVLFLLYSVAIIAGIGCNSGKIQSPTFSNDGHVVAFFDYKYEQVYFADSQGSRMIGKGNRLAMSRDGRYVLTIQASDVYVQGGDAMTLYEVATGKHFTAAVPDGHPMFTQGAPAQRRGWPSDSTVEVYIQNGPVVTFGLDTLYFRWRPNAEWTKATCPSDSSRAQMEVYKIHHGPLENPTVEFGSDGWNARRTIWVAPDGKTVELLRQDDIPARMCWLVVDSPLLDFDTFTRLYHEQIVVDTKGEDQSKPKAQLAALISQRQAATTRPAESK